MSGLDIRQLKYAVVEPTLQALSVPPLVLMGAAALNLVTGTALAESGAQFVQQVGGGPALSLWQVEPATEQDCWTNFLAYQEGLAARVRSLLAPGATTPQLVTNLAYGVAMCRLKYWRNGSALPAPTDATAMAQYHKDVYNTALGAAVVANNVPLFAMAISA